LRILFCNIAWMNYYKGNLDGNDKPQNGGSYVLESGDANEKFNFFPIALSRESTIYPDGEYCLGFVETKSTNGTTQNQLNLEKINGCEGLKKAAEVEDVLVIYCAKFPDSFTYETYVVGWYKHATVYRYYSYMKFGDGETQAYNAIAKKSDCVLLPRGVRRRSNVWHVPRKKKGISYGFGQSNVWFASDSKDNESLKQFLERITKQIDEYSGENWIDKYE